MARKRDKIIDRAIHLFFPYEQRVSVGLLPLEANATLAQAAQAKAADMLNNNYWAHVSPDGTQPWSFFVNAGYSYRYAGENLARDFTNPASAVDAWMASPTNSSVFRY